MAKKPTGLLGFSVYCAFYRNFGANPDDNLDAPQQTPQPTTEQTSRTNPTMHLTTKGRYAVTAMIDLAIHQPQGPVTLKSISENQGISLPYLEQLFSMLRRGNLVVGTRGPGGGYVLARGAESISMADIVVAVDEPLDITQCDGREDCHAGKRCLSHDLWSALSDQLYAFLSGIRLGDMYQLYGDASSSSRRLGAQRVPLPKVRGKN